jgi:beta-lactamase class A
MIKREKTLKAHYVFSIIICFLITFIFIISCINILKSINKTNSTPVIYEDPIDVNNSQIKYTTCLNEKYNDTDLTEDILQEINKIDTDLNNYHVSVEYLSPDLDFSYKYNADKLYYAASTIKVVDSLYIYENASNGSIDLDTTVKYTASNKIGASKIISTYPIGSMISLRDLVKAAITVSDNSAHDMLIKYIGFKNLKNFGNSLGAVYTLWGGDNFGSINVDDATAYLKELNSFINNNKELGSELKSYYINSEQNYLNIDDFMAAEKYGEYGSYYHELGIVYTKHPYLVSILTLEGYHDKEQIIRHINAEINELNEMFYQARSSRCYLYAFGE